MSGHGFHVHGPHDHELEHAAHGNDDFASRIAVMTAIMATVGALFGYEGGATQNDAAMFKNEAAIKKPKQRTNGIFISQNRVSKIWLNSPWYCPVPMQKNTKPR
jgi:hypothetical protein